MTKAKTKVLFLLCSEWNKNSCSKRELSKLYKKYEFEGARFSWPKGKELKKFNDYCKGCNEALEIEKKECPICGNKLLFKSDLFGFNKKTPLSIYYVYFCKECERELNSYKKLE
ncbi:hypothetical protein ACFLRM_05785 [Acidobacteriota bacterium]